MFIGHFAVGLASKKLAPRTNLAWLLAAPLFLDLLWPVFLVAGIEHASLVKDAPTPFLVLGLDDYPWSHSLLMALVWSAAMAAVYFAAARDRRGSSVIAAGVFSHWVLDLVTHRPDLQLAPGVATEVGLGLWYSTAGTVATEATLFIVGVVLYLGATRARGLAGKISIATLVGFLAVAYTASILSPPPPSIEAVGAAGLASFLIIPWAWWIDRTRPAAARGLEG
jgi:membrane-bound metal-dependent hydrolase YbcI (DUF457 family)